MQPAQPSPAQLTAAQPTLATSRLSLQVMAGLFALSLASYLAGLFVSGQTQRSSS